MSKANIKRFYGEMARAIRLNNMEEWEEACKTKDPHRAFAELLKKKKYS